MDVKVILIPICILIIVENHYNHVAPLRLYYITFKFCNEIYKAGERGRR